MGQVTKVSAPSVSVKVRVGAPLPFSQAVPGVAPAAGAVPGAAASTQGVPGAAPAPQAADAAMLGGGGPLSSLGLPAGSPASSAPVASAPPAAPADPLGGLFSMLQQAMGALGGGGGVGGGAPGGGGGPGGLLQAAMGALGGGGGPGGLLQQAMGALGGGGGGGLLQQAMGALGGGGGAGGLLQQMMGGGSPATPTTPTTPGSATGRDAMAQAFGGWNPSDIKNFDYHAPMGHNGRDLLNQADQKWAAGDRPGAQQLWNQAQQTSSPVMFDLNGDGKMGTTGASTAKDRKPGEQVGKTISMADGNGGTKQIEWMDGKGDGMLIDDSDGKAAGDMNMKRMFGDEDGKYANGYDKMKAFAAKNGYDVAANGGVLKGPILDKLKMWVDNGDGKVDKGEMKSLSQLGITEIGADMTVKKNARGEDLMTGAAKKADGSTIGTEDVWFANKSRE